MKKYIFAVLFSIASFCAVGKGTVVVEIAKTTETVAQASQIGLGELNRDYEDRFSCSDCCYENREWILPLSCLGLIAVIVTTITSCVALGCE